MDDVERRQIASADSDGAVYTQCNLCRQRIRLDPDRVVIVHWEVLYRCQQCGWTFRLHSDDAVAIGAPTTATTAGRTLSP